MFFLPVTLFICFFVCIIILLSSIKIVKQQTAFTVETFGKFSRVVYPGLNIVIPIIENTSRRINLSTQSFDMSIMAITSDKVNINIETTLIYRVIEQKVYQATYLLDNPTGTIQAYVENAIRAFVATQTHEQVIQSRDEMTTYLVGYLRKRIEEYGYSIDSFQIRDIVLPREITDAMSRVISSKRNQEAVLNDAESSYILAVKKAEADKQAQLLEGQGVALERDAIVKGLAQSVKEMQAATGLSSAGVMNIILLNQYMDMMGNITNDKDGNTKTVFVNPNPQGMGEILQQMSGLMSKSE